MKITFLGTSHGIAEPDRFCSSAVVSVGGNNYIIDAGAPISTLYPRYGYDFSHLKGIFITHSHSDHTVGLAELTFQIEGFGRYKGLHIPVYVPDTRFSEPLRAFVDACSGGGDTAEKQSSVDFFVYPDGEIYDDGVARIISVPVAHYPNAHAFIIEAEGKRVCFTGDIKGDLRDYPRQILEQDFDAVICEGAHVSYDRPEVCAILSESRTKAMYVNHIFDQKNTPEKMAAFASTVNFPVKVASDGETFEI